MDIPMSINRQSNRTNKQLAGAVAATITAKEDEILTAAARHVLNTPTTVTDRGRLILSAILREAATMAGFSLPFDLAPLYEGKILPPDLDYEYLIKNPSIFDGLYEALIPADYRKQRGQFITPQRIARFMVGWGMRTNPSSVLDPAVGTGIFLDEVLGLEPTAEVCGIDIDPLVLNICGLRLRIQRPQARVTLLLSDFLTLDAWQRKFDFIICNPPYLDFHDFDRATIRPLEKRLGLRLSKLTNIYSLFFMRSTEWLSYGGRMAFITPSEFLYTGYGSQLKEFLLRYFLLDALILTDFDSLAFRNALTTSAVTLLKRVSPPTDYMVRLIRASTWPNDTALLSLLDSGASALEGCKVFQVSSSELHPNQKWLIHFADSELKALLRGLVPLSTLATVNRGIATGANEFFTLTLGELKKWQIEEEFTLPCITRTMQAPGYDFKWDDFCKWRDAGQKAFLLYCSSYPSSNVQSYLRHGERLGVHQRYIPRHREPWYSSERQKPAPILATVFSRNRMRFVFNEALVRTLTPFHCVYPKSDEAELTRALLAYLNSNMCLLIQTIMRREYGGGLHKFEPKDLEQLLVPDVRSFPSERRSRLACLFDDLKTATRTGLNESHVKNAIDAELKHILSN